MLIDPKQTVNNINAKRIPRQALGNQPRNVLNQLAPDSVPLVKPIHQRLVNEWSNIYNRSRMSVKEQTYDGQLIGLDRDP